MSCHLLVHLLFPKRRQCQKSTATTANFYRCQQQLTVETVFCHLWAKPETQLTVNQTCGLLKKEIWRTLDFEVLAEGLADRADLIDCKRLCHKEETESRIDQGHSCGHSMIRDKERDTGRAYHVIYCLLHLQLTNSSTYYFCMYYVVYQIAYFQLLL